MKAVEAKAQQKLEAAQSLVEKMLVRIGQANYAAANGMLDSLGACRRTRAMNATSGEWGPWAAVGMAARSSMSREPLVGCHKADGEGAPPG